MAVVAENYASDLVEDPAFSKVFLPLVAHEAKAARKVILFGSNEETADETGMKVAFARGTLAVLKQIVRDIYEDANVKVPEHIASLFE